MKNLITSTDNSSGLQVEGLSKSWRENTVFSDLSFSQKTGSIYGVSGDNGSGKSTLLKILASVLSRDKGQISFAGISLDDLSAWRPMIGYVPQELALDENLTVRENLRFWAALRGLSRQEIKEIIAQAKADQLVAEFLEKPIKKCSGGMARRASLLVGLLGSPSLILLDEPFAGADQGSRSLMLDHLSSLRTQGRTILVTSHEYGVLEQVCDQILYLQQGKIASSL